MFECCLFCLLFMLAGNLWAEDVTITIDVSSLSGTDGNYTWNSGGVSGVADCNIYNGLFEFTQNKFFIKNSTVLPGYISTVIIERNDNKNEWQLYVRNREINRLTDMTPAQDPLVQGNTLEWNNLGDKKVCYFYLVTLTPTSIRSITIKLEPIPQPLTLVAQQNGTFYATFSNTQPTFFPSTEGVTIMTAYVDGGKLNTPEINNDEGGVYVPANTGVLVSSASPTVNYLYSNNKAEKNVENNMLHPATEEMSGNNLFYKLAYDNYTNKTGLGFYWGAANGAAFDRKAGTAYLAVPKSSEAKGFHFDFDGETSVEALERSDSNAPVYNLQGQKVTDEYRGVYIRSGKKYFKK